MYYKKKQIKKKLPENSVSGLMLISPDTSSNAFYRFVSNASLRTLATWTTDDKDTIRDVRNIRDVIKVGENLSKTLKIIPVLHTRRQWGCTGEKRKISNCK